MSRLILIALLLLISADAFAVCLRPDGVEGEIIYNRDRKVTQYCDGDAWIGMGWKRAPTNAAGGNGQLQFAQGGKMASSPNLIWDDENASLALRGSGSINSSITIFEAASPRTNRLIMGADHDGSFIHGTYGSGGTSTIRFLRETNTESMRLTSQGNVGIGTATPAAKLHVSAGTTNGIHIQTANSGPWGLTIENVQAGVRGLQIFQNNDGTVRFHNNYNTGGFLVLNSANERMGVHINTPSYALHVAGAVAGGGAYVNTSDGRLKSNVGNITYGLDTVLKLRPVHFEWTQQDEEWQRGRKLGLIAQEAEVIVPEVVSTAEDAMGTKSIAYGDLVPVLIKAMQEQQAQIEALKGEIEILKTGR